MSARGVLRIIEDGEVGFWCAGCQCMHAIPIEGEKAWAFDGNYDKPTFAPSILVTGGHYVAGWPGKNEDGTPRPPHCYCNFAERFPDAEPMPWKCRRCHSFVRAGNIEFLADCSHELAGKTVALEAL